MGGEREMNRNGTGAGHPLNGPSEVFLTRTVSMVIHVHGIRTSRCSKYVIPLLYTTSI